ncbi:MAG: ABC transporter permease [Bacteroidota bacterium]
MLENHIKVAWRSIIRHPWRSSISTINLAVSVVLVFFIAQYVLFEFSFDENWAKKDQLFALQSTQTNEKTGTKLSLQLPPAFATTAVSDFPEVMAAARVFRFAQGAYAADDKVFEEPQGKVAYVDADFFELFDFEWIAGNEKALLNAPNKVVLSRKYAQKYFGRTNVVGEQIKYADIEQPLEVQGVFEDLPENVHFEFELLLSITSNPYFADGFLETTWTNSLFNTYLLLEKDGDLNALKEKFNTLNQEKRAAILAANSIAETLELLPVTALHTQPKLVGQFKTTTNQNVLWGLSIVVFLILGIAYVNFANLELLKVLKDTKTIGVRKVMGAHASQLTQYFLVRAGLFSGMAFLVAFFIYTLGLPYFKNYLESDLLLPESYQFGLIIGAVSLMLIGLFLIGYLPVRWMTTRAAKQLIFSQDNSSLSKNNSSRGLLFFQFTTAIVLLIVALVTTRQVNFMLSYDIGLDLENTLVFRAPSVYEDYEQLDQNWENFKFELNQLASVQSVISISDIPGEESAWLTSFSRQPLTSGSQIDRKRLNRLSVSGSFLGDFSNDLLAGRDFRDNFAADSNSVILNEKAINLFGFSSPEVAIGQQLYSRDETLKIIGVSSDFHQLSLKNDVQPLMMTYYPSVASYLLVKANSTVTPELEAKLTATYQKAFPNNPIDYFYLKTFFERQYANNQKQSQLLWSFTVFAIFICCVGLFALTAFSVQQRTKEIGIRKVLGASVTGIVALLSKDFVKLVGIAFIIATPIAYYCMNEWLQDFAYRVELQWWVFALAGLAAIGIALLTVSVQSVRAALANPVRSLRSE